MAVVRNHFEKELSDASMIYITITGLTSENSILNNVSCNIESSLYLLRSIYKSLIDAGYTDVIKNEEEYSISVFGFKFFVINAPYSNNSKINNIDIYIYGAATRISNFDKNSSGCNSIISEDCTKISFDIIIRGDKNCVYISYISAKYPLLERPIIFIAKSKNLITSEDAFFCYSYESLGAYIRNKNNLYNLYNLKFNDSNYGLLQTKNTMAGLSIPSKFVCEPITCYYGSFLVYSILKCNLINFCQMKYYKIGTDIYYCCGYTTGSSAIPTGAPFLFKVS